MELHKLIKKNEKITVAELAERYFGTKEILPFTISIFFYTDVMSDKKIKIDDSSYPIMVERK